MPLWQKVQRQSRDVPVEVLPDMSQVDNVETLDIEASQAPLWSSAHMKTEKTMWQTVRLCNTTLNHSCDPGLSQLPERPARQPAPLSCIDPCADATAAATSTRIRR